MNGVKRVLVFCILIVILPATLIIIPLYLRKTVFADVTYAVAESDIIEIRDGISSIFCQQHSLRMSSNFNAFQLSSKPEISTNRKHIRLKKSMTLPDDTLEYWGFYLLKGAKVHLKFCSRYAGSSILVVKGQRDLRTCGLLEHNKNKLGANLAQGHEMVKVFFEDITEIAENVPIEELERRLEESKRANGDYYMESENHGGEDLSEDNEGTAEVTNTSIALPIRTNQLPLKKLGERDNHGGENLSESIDKRTDVVNTTIALPIRTNKLLRKKLGERENHGSEDLSDYERRTEVVNTTISVPIKTTKLPRKKLKKGTPNSMRRRTTQEAATAKDNIFKTSKETLYPLHATEKDGSSDVANRPRRHNIASKDSTENNDMVAKDKSDQAHYLKHKNEHARRKQQVYDQLYKRRSKREHVYDRKISHGGNAVNFTETDQSNSISSFETGLLDCYNGDILLAKGFPPLPDCLSPHFLENGSHRMLSQHDINEDGYYYYIFYSDNDNVRNDIHAIFDIYKPTFQFSNFSDSQGCINTTNCTFSIGFLSDEIVVVEVPTRDGIEHEEDDITYLISTCHPRTEIYAIFPIAVLILILSCSFL